MFRFIRTKSRVHVQTQSVDVGLLHILSARKIMQGSYAAEKLYEIKQLVSVTKDEWESYYLATTYRFAEYVQELPDRICAEYSCNYGLLNHALDRAVIGLKLRRGYMLPFGSDTETCYREQDIWTLAVFAASLFIDVWQVPAKNQVLIYNKNSIEANKWNALLGFPMGNESAAYYKAVAINNSNECLSKLNHILVRALLPVQVLSLLSEHQSLFYQWLEYLLGESSDTNALFTIINKSHELLVSADNVLDEYVKPGRNVLLGDENKTDKEAVRHINLANEFVHWIKQSIMSNDIITNAENSILHRVSDGILIVFPDSLDRFKNEAVTSDGELLNNDNCFIRNNENDNEKNNYIHEYYIGDWKNLNCISGLLIDPEHLFSEETLPEISHDLSRKPEL